MAIYQEMCVSVVRLLFFLGIYPKRILKGEGAKQRHSPQDSLVWQKRKEILYQRPTTGHGVSKLGCNTKAAMWSKIPKNFNDMGELLS